ncbi:MAG TPA: class I SAM-dependent methyltransferase [Caulobacteraceae bacterium]|jgi:ubiquinone/menaquinone biosynthesis C-methylase UbiE|nr:class I SAM-dependent methyltransferase [Caulobacteraceae bacterium]
MSDADQLPRRRIAFAPDARAARALGAVKAAWWTANGWAARRLSGRPSAPAGFTPTSSPPPAGYVRAAWREAFDKDAVDVAAGLYPLAEAAPVGPLAPFQTALDLIGDARAVEARRRREGRAEIRDEADLAAYPVYYRQNFHYQSGGWFTPESARRYEAQVEALFSGAAGPMRRRALSLLARAWKDRDQRGLRLVDLACGSGSFLTDLRGAFPRATVMGLDLSAAYLAEARARSGAAVIQAAAERLPFADASLDGIACVYLFHELPPKVRTLVAAEIARVLRPGGVLAFADSVQAADEPELGRLLEAFPAFFHEPYYESYQGADLDALFAAAGLTRRDADKAFLTKAVLYAK